MQVAQDIIEKDGFYHLDGFGPLAYINRQVESNQVELKMHHNPQLIQENQSLSLVHERPE